MTSEQVVQNQLVFYNNHDIEGFLSTYSSDIKAYYIDEDKPFLDGMDDLKKRYTERFTIPNLHADIANRIVIGNYVIDNEHITGLKENAITNAVAIYEVKDDLIRKVWFLFE